MDARLTGALVFCGAGAAMTAAVTMLLSRSGRQLLAGIGGEQAGQGETAGAAGRMRGTARTAMRGLSNLLAGCLCLATFGFVLFDISRLWDPDFGALDADRVIHQQSGLLASYTLAFGLLYLLAVLILLGFRTHLRRGAEAPLMPPQLPAWPTSPRRP